MLEQCDWGRSVSLTKSRQNIALKPYCEPKPTFFYLLYCSNKIINKILQITQRICNTSSSVNLSQGRIKYGNSILEQFSSKPLETVN